MAIEKTKKNLIYIEERITDLLDVASKAFESQLCIIREQDILSQDEINSINARIHLNTLYMRASLTNLKGYIGAVINPQNPKAS